MDHADLSPDRSSRKAPAGNVVALPGAATLAVRQPRGGATGAYRKAHPWPGRWNEQPAWAEDPEREAFSIVYHAAMVTNARWKLVDAKRAWARVTHAPEDEQSLLRRVFTQAFDDHRAAIVRLAATPAPDKLKLRAKAHAIGNIWLGAEGEWYDALRAAIARDAERLGTKNPAPPDPLPRPFSEPPTEGGAR